MNNERDTKFLGFAKLLWNELKPDLQLDYLEGSLQDSWALANEFEPLDLPALEARAQLLIAQRTYDLAVHVIGQREMSSDRLAKTILSSDCFTDLTEWPAQEP